MTDNGDSHLEIERKYQVPDAARLPLDFPGTTVSSVEHRLTAEYLDTADGVLLANGMTLRRRTGGHDAGWHLKVPAGPDARTEFAAPLGEPGQVPADLLDRIRAWVRDRPLRPVATVESTRGEHRLTSPDGAVLAEIADDRVRARAYEANGSVSLRSWREWEFELVDGRRKLFAQADKAFRTAGATPADYGSKLAHALGDPPAAPTSSTRKGSAGAVLQTALTELVAELLDRDHQVRRDEPEGIHKMRVATRRIRSALTTFKACFDRTRTDPLRDELRWLAASLGNCRDLQVLTERFDLMVQAEPDELVLGPVRRRIQLGLGTDYRTAFQNLTQDLNSERYFRLLDALDELVRTPPFAAEADRKAAKVLPAAVGRSWKRLARSADEARAHTGPPGAHRQDDHPLHDTRKAAKKVRYACELLEPTFDGADKLADAAEYLQELLGEHQDSVVARDRLRTLAAAAQQAGESSFTLGRLHALEQSRAVAVEEAFDQAWAVASRKKLRRWLG